MKKIVFATNNKHKLAEAKQILSPDFEVVSLSEIGCHDEIPETADTLEGNAFIKARWVKERYGYDCFADDTGLMVDALDGAPGVYSARYAGENCTPEDNVRLLLRNLEGRADRSAHFSTVIALISEGREVAFEGSVHGEIADSPAGSNGFGYDPVFIAEESGKRFSEMSAEAKNKISHRGRAMEKLRKFLMVVMLILSFAAAASAASSQWRLHSSYDGQMEKIAVTSQDVWLLGAAQPYISSNSILSELYGMLYRYSKEDQSLEWLNKSNLLSGNIVRSMAYNYDKKYLAVAFEDGTINLIHDNGDVSTVLALKVADSSLDKTVNDITFDKEENKMYLATNFGYVVVDDRLCEVETSRVFNVKCNSVAKFKDKIWVAADDGLFYGDSSEFDLSAFKKVSSLTYVNQLIPIAGKDMYFTNGKNPRCAKIVYDGQSCSPVNVSDIAIKRLERGRDGLLLVAKNELNWVDLEGNVTRYSIPADYVNSDFGSVDGKEFWVSSGRKGISCLKAPANSAGKWTVVSDRFLPNASSAFQCASMAYHPEYGMLVRNHGYEQSFNSRVYSSYDLIAGYKDMQWTPLSTTYRTDMKGLLIDNPFGLTIDPSNSNHVYCGSVRSGLLRLDLANPEKSIHMSKPSDFLGGNGLPGFAAIVPDNDPKTTWGEQCVFAAPKFDKAGNLWTAFVNPEKGNGSCVSTYTELWIWPEAARKATTDASNVSGWKQIRFDDIETDNVPMVLPLKSSANKNIVLHCGNTVRGPLVIFDHNGTIDNTSDDRISKMKSIIDQDGNDVPFVKVHAWYEDESTGLVWVSYGSGLFTFNPAEALTNPGNVRRLKVARNDGTNLADFLLENVKVNAIISDPQGRKWFATSGAGLVCTSSDGRQILASYTTDNSDIPDNTVFSLAYNPSNGAMMISTDKGLCEFFISSASGASGSDVRAYPNPVHPDYFGYVTIDGLPQDAMVKIVDAAGNLIKECGSADNGSLQWDVTNLYFKRVPGGVYYVMISNGPNADSYSEVSKILVVN